MLLVWKTVPIQCPVTIESGARKLEHGGDVVSEAMRAFSKVTTLHLVAVHRSYDCPIYPGFSFFYPNATHLVRGRDGWDSGRIG